MDDLTPKASVSKSTELHGRASRLFARAFSPQPAVACILSFMTHISAKRAATRRRTASGDRCSSSAISKTYSLSPWSKTCQYARVGQDQQANCGDNRRINSFEETRRTATPGTQTTQSLSVHDCPSSTCFAGINARQRETQTPCQAQRRIR